MVVVHGYKYGYGGIGDMLRSMFAYFVFCKKHDIEYYLDFSDTNLHYCFENAIPEQFKHWKHDKGLKIFKQIGSTATRETHLILEYIKNDANKNKPVFIYSNIFDFVPYEELLEHTSEFLEFLKFSKDVLNKVNQNLKDLEITLGSYSSIHVRCGDAFMDRVNIMSDSRITHNQAISKMDKIMAFLNKKFPGSPVLLFTDNQQLKNRSLILGTKVLDTIVHHTALTSVSADEIQGTIDAVVEFYVMGHSKCIVSVRDSGFSFWSSFIFEVPLYKLNDKDDVVKFNFTLKY